MNVRAVRKMIVQGMVACACLALFLPGGPARAADSAPATPQATIETLTQDALATLQKNKGRLKSSPAEVAAQIADIVDPYLDFKIMSEEVLGLGWRRADDGQRARFESVFKQLLTNDYAAVFKQYKNQTLKVTGSRWDDAAHRRATVSSQLESPGAQPVEVDYRMYHTDGRWQIYDVVVEDVSLLINYREVFASELQHESLDALIAQLSKKVAEQVNGSSH